MSEEKMREEHWRQWGISGMPKDKIRLAEETWKACAAIKDAEKHSALVAKELQMAELSGKLLKEIASRDLMIKELRGALLDSTNLLRAMNGDAYEQCQCQADDNEQALAKSEHHDSRALEKMLLEARIDELEAYTTGRFFLVERMKEHKAKLAELNKE